MKSTSVDKLRFPCPTECQGSKYWGSCPTECHEKKLKIVSYRASIEDFLSSLGWVMLPEFCALLRHQGMAVGSRL